jgi:hypothetical protein
MAIKLIEREHTVRTYPRLMKNRTTETIVMILHDHIGGIVFLNGEKAGQIVESSMFNWGSFDDLTGSVTLHNAD